MKLFKVYEVKDPLHHIPFSVETDVYVVCDTFGEAEQIFLKKYPKKKIDRVGVHPEEVIVKGMGKKDISGGSDDVPKHMRGFPP